MLGPSLIVGKITSFEASRYAGAYLGSTERFDTLNGFVIVVCSSAAAFAVERQTQGHFRGGAQE